MESSIPIKFWSSPMASDNTAVQTMSGELHAVPLTLEGLSVLHQMFRFRWPEWRKLSASHQQEIAREAAAALSQPEEAGQSAVYSLLGHKGDLMLVHFRDSFDELNTAELALNRTALQEYLEPTHSYLSVVELGLYDSSVKLFRQLAERGIVPFSDEWNRELEETMERQRQAMRPRLYPKIPDSRYLCFYPMDRRRGEERELVHAAHRRAPAA
jgi:peroxiredoxin